VITPEADGFLIYGAEENRQWFIPGIGAVKDWLDENEQEYAGPDGAAGGVPGGACAGP
jgi:hypothetical protein